MLSALSFLSFLCIKSSNLWSIIHHYYGLSKDKEIEDHECYVNSSMAKMSAGIGIGIQVAQSKVWVLNRYTLHPAQFWGPKCIFSFKPLSS